MSYGPRCALRLWGKWAGEAGFSRVLLALVISPMGLVHKIDYLSCFLHLQGTKFAKAVRCTTGILAQVVHDIRLCSTYCVFSCFYESVLIHPHIHRSSTPDGGLNTHGCSLQSRLRCLLYILPLFDSKFFSFIKIKFRLRSNSDVSGL